jgi:hypothetical protein
MYDLAMTSHHRHRTRKMIRLHLLLHHIRDRREPRRGKTLHEPSV